MKSYTWTREDGFVVTTDLSKVDLEKVAMLYREDDWSINDRPIEVSISALKHSVSFICLDGDIPVATVRLITDYTTTAYAADMIVRKDYRGKGISKFVFECIFKVPIFKNMRRINLQTPDAHSLYARYGFNLVAHPEEMMERLSPYEVTYQSYYDNKDLIDE